MCDCLWSSELPMLLFRLWAVSPIGGLSFERGWRRRVELCPLGRDEGREAMVCSHMMIPCASLLGFTWEARLRGSCESKLIAPFIRICHALMLMAGREGAESLFLREWHTVPPLPLVWG